jgi:hypothetical protein
MRVSDEALQELIALYQAEFGEALTTAKAAEMAHRLLALYALLGEKLPHERKLPSSEEAEPRRPIGFHV